MMTKLFAVAALGIAGFTLYSSLSQRSALALRQENQNQYWPRHRTYVSGGYRSGVWVPLPVRSSYGSFQGGGPSSGK